VLRIAVTSEPPLDAPVHPDCVAALSDAATLLAELGHEITEAAPRWRVPGLIDDFISVWQTGPSLYPANPELFTPLNRELAERARATSSADYVAAVFRLQAAARAIVAFWDLFDVVLTPTLALPPVPIGWQEEGGSGAIDQLERNTLFTPFTAVANLTGLPAVSLPLRWSNDGLPIGVQAIGPPAGEALLLRLSAQLEEARPWAARRPPLS
jgi:amidase